MVKITKSKPRAKPRKGLWLIAAFKLLKGLILLAVGMGALSLLHENVAVQVTHWIALLRVDPKNRFIHMLIRKLWTVDDTRLVAISAGTGAAQEMGGVLHNCRDQLADTTGDL